MTDTTSTDHGDFTIHRRDHRHNDHLAYVQIWVERPADCIHCRQPITVGSEPATLIGLSGGTGPAAWLDIQGSHDHQHGCGTWNTPDERLIDTSGMDDDQVDRAADLATAELVFETKRVVQDDQSDRAWVEMMSPTTLSDAICGVGGYLGVVADEASPEWCDDMTERIGEPVRCDYGLPTGRGLWLDVTRVSAFLDGFLTGRDLIEQWETACEEAIELVAEA